MKRSRSIPRVLGEFFLFLTLSYLLLELFFSYYYNFTLITSSALVGTFFNMNIEYNFFNLEKIEFVTNMVMYHPSLEKSYLAGFIIQKDLIEKIDLILFKLPLLVAVVLTFSRTLKTAIISLSIIFSTQMIFGTIIVLDMMFTAAKSNILLKSYLNFYGISETIIDSITELKLFFYIWFQKFLPFLVGFYLWVVGGYRFVAFKYKNLLLDLNTLRLKVLKVKK